MKIFKTPFIMLIALLVIFMVSGCQKDSVSPKQQEGTYTESASANQNVKENTSKQQSKTETNNTKTSTSENKSETASQKSAGKGERSNSTQSKSTSVKKQAPTSAKIKTATKPNTNSTSTATSKPNTNQNNNTNKSKPKTTPTAPKPKLTVTISIVSKDLNKTILSPTQVTIQNGDTFLSATRTILKQKGIPISVRGSGASAYVEGIGDLYEFDHGPLSGWIAEKNGVKLDRSAGVKTVKSGDQVRWIYTTDYTKDTK